MLANFCFFRHSTDTQHKMDQSELLVHAYMIWIKCSLPFDCCSISTAMAIQLSTGCLRQDARYYLSGQVSEHHSCAKVSCSLRRRTKAWLLLRERDWLEDVYERRVPDAGHSSNGPSLIYLEIDKSPEIDVSRLRYLPNTREIRLGRWMNALFLCSCLGSRHGLGM